MVCTPSMALGPCRVTPLAWRCAPSPLSISLLSSPSLNSVSGNGGWCGIRRRQASKEMGRWGWAQERRSWCASSRQQREKWLHYCGVDNMAASAGRKCAQSMGNCIFCFFFLIITVGRARCDRHFHCRFKTDGDEVRYHRSLSPAKGQNQ